MQPKSRLSGKDHSQTTIGTKYSIKNKQVVVWVAKEKRREQHVKLKETEGLSISRRIPTGPSVTMKKWWVEEIKGRKLKLHEGGSHHLKEKKVDCGWGTVELLQPQAVQTQERKDFEKTGKKSEFLLIKRRGTGQNRKVMSSTTFSPRGGGGNSRLATWVQAGPHTAWERRS